MRVNRINRARIDLPPADRIQTGMEGLARRITGEAQPGRTRRVVIDGMWGTRWSLLGDALRRAAADCDLRVRLMTTASALRKRDELIRHFAPWLTENPTFGRVCERPIHDYFAPATYDRLVQDFNGASDADLVVLMGPGALSEATAGADLRIYCDVPRETIIDRQNRSCLGNFGLGERVPGHSPYKIALYVEWPLLLEHKRRIWDWIDLYLSDWGEVAWLTRAGLERIVADVCRRPILCKPFFMPGVWGGHRLQEAAGIGQDWANCAWDFEVIAPENAVILAHGDATITVPFLVLMDRCARAIVGEYVHRQFGADFPIRFNYLDTMDGTNLSLQVHPHAGYIRERFGERIPQDETYYVVEHKPGSRVFLGLRSGVTRAQFREAVRRAEEEFVPFDIADYATGWPARQGALYLIPAGTLHCSGANNLVLEISATTYWYTFKLYDYLRPDLNGRPRPINAAFGFDVLDMSRDETYVRQALIPEPMVARTEAGGTELHLGTHPQIFFAVHRLDVRTHMRDDTDGRFHVLAVVGGRAARLRSVREPDVAVELEYLETAVVPAAFGPYVVEAVEGPCQVVKAFVKR